MDLKIGFLVLKNFYTREIRPQNWHFKGHFQPFFVILLLRIAETPLILLPVFKNGPPKSDFIVPKNIYAR